MADERLRRLERAAADDPAARVRWYQARLLRGDLTHLRLKLAAHLGDEAAREALGPDHYSPPESFRDWVRILTGGGKETCVRAAAAAVRGRAPTPKWSEAVDVIEAWIECPCRDHARAARDLMDRHGVTHVGAFAGPDEEWILRAVGELNLSRAAHSAATAILGERDPSEEEQRALKSAIAGELLPWLLGDRAPLPPTELSDR